jgi:hypothetical protein
MVLRSEAPLRVPFWVAFLGCFVELMGTVGTNVRIRSPGLANPKQVNVRAKVAKLRMKGMRHVSKRTEK